MNSSNSYEGITLFAAVKTFYESGNDILSAVCSLCLVTVSDGENLEDIKTHFHDRYKVEMPSAVLGTILKRLKRNQLLDYGPHFSGVQLSGKGKQEAASLSLSIDGLNRDFAALVGDMNAFFEKRSYPKLQAPEKELISFIDENLGYTSLALTSRQGGQEVGSHIAEYILHVENANPSMFVLMQNIFFGRLYLSMIKTRADYSANVNMEPTEVFLDTSLVMSLLGLHEKVDCDNAKELLAILANASNVSVCIFSETLNEARRLINAYKPGVIDFTHNIPVRSIHYQLRLQGYDRHRISLLLETLEDRVDKLGIKIKDLPFADENDDNYEEIRSELSTWAELMDHPKSIKTLDHDAKALYVVSRIRGRAQTKLFEKCKALFVSPDRAIHEMTSERSRKSNKLPLSMMPLDIVSLLWMRDISNSQIATNVLRQSVMAYVREKAISKNLWGTFVAALKEAQDQEQLSRDDIAMILASDDVARLLAEKQYDAPQQILNPDYVQELRDKNDHLAEKAKRGGHLEERLKARLRKVAHILATVSTHLLFVGTVLILALLLYILVTSLGVDRVASIVGIAIFVIPVMFAALTGREFKVNAVLIKWRKGLYDKMHGAVYSRLESYFVGSTNVKPEVSPSQAE